MNNLLIADEGVMYADDTTIVYVYIKSIDLKVNNMLMSLLDWCRYNKMAL